MKELLFSLTKKDFEITYFSGSGAGGQHRNKHMNCVRIKHKDSGIMSTCQEHKSLEQNKKTAFERLVKDEKFKIWIRSKAGEKILESSSEKSRVEDILQEMMSPVNLKIEIEKDGEWIDE